MKKNGYTIIEMLVVIAIMAIMSSIFITSSTPRQKMDLQRDAYYFVQNVRRGQELSLAVYSFAACNGYTPQGGYGIYMQQGEKTDDRYYLFGDCNSDWEKGNKPTNLNLETLEGINLVEGGMTKFGPGIKFKDIKIVNPEISGTWITCKGFWAQYAPPDPKTYLWCETEDSSCRGASKCTSTEAFFTIYQKNGEKRDVHMNEAGLVYTEVEK